MCLNIGRRFYSVLLICTLFNISCSELLYLNDECVVIRTNANGTCKFASDCPQIQNEVLNYEQFPTLCGFEKNKEIICCPNENQTDLSSRVDTEDRISVQSMLRVKEMS